MQVAASVTLLQQKIIKSFSR